MRLIGKDASRNGVHTLNVKVASDDIIVSLRGYMIVRDDATGNTTTYYTQIVSRSYNG